ncbi:NUDIX domain-containing protein [Roseicitreum antarcticum]|uniref:8-oxo-dGTP diphosphatase n=1 Tax=Roseicitreum antarcticum TaxID=564137 RepID=A0A1H2X368_9RHOB|nr:NUDIX hydrolase [Roseicitreum antarcticum]SDW87227.1 8-oxo-dGTP diphosphatase [Roseicitreum antarcticum]
MIRRFGAPRNRAQTYTRRPGVYAVLLRGTDVLLTFQAEPEPEFQLPGGGIDPGEAALPALHREVWEETGWRMAPLRRLGAFRRFAYMPEYDLWAEKRCTVYLARPVRCYGAPVEPGHTAAWVPLADAAALLGNPGDRHFMAAVARRIAG